MHPPVFFVRAGKMAAAQILSVTKLPARRYNKAREKVMHMRDIGKNIRDARVKGGITQDQLAERLHVSRQTISHYETGHTRPDIEMLEQIAQALDVDMTILLYGPPPRPDRQREIRRLAMGAGITALFLAAYGISAGPAADLFSSYFLSLSWFRSTLLLPCVCLGLGWTVFQACGLLLKARPLSGTFGRWLHLVLLAVPICYFVLMAPFFWYLLRISLEVWQQLQTGAGVAHSSSFSYPGILNQLFLSLFRHWKLAPAVFFMIGAGLWMTGRRFRATPETPSADPTTTDET